MTQSLPRKHYALLTLLGLGFSLGLMLYLDGPDYTDAAYYYNAGAQLASGQGLSDSVLWNYVNAPEELPAASHRYWMPLASLLVALPMALLGTGFTTAQLILIPFYIGMGLLGMWLGWEIGGTGRHAWVAGLTVLLGGFFLPFWLTTDTFAIFGLLGAGALIAMGRLRQLEGSLAWSACAGALSALAHLSRADGLLLLLVGLLAIGWRGSRQPWRDSLALLGAYLLLMLPWFLRNMSVLGSPLPSGGVSTIFLRGYNDLFNYPAVWTLEDFLDWGLGNILQSRWEGLVSAFATWLAVEGFVVLSPLALWALWHRRRQPFLFPMLLYALGLHLAMSLVFTYPGIRGGLFHSSAALLPFWVALGLDGLDRAIATLARWRGWKRRQAQRFFGTVVLLLPLGLGLNALSVQHQQAQQSADYWQYADSLPADARLMANDPPGWFYRRGLTTVILPNGSLDNAQRIAQRYCLTHLLIDEHVTDAFRPLLQGTMPAPAFLTEVLHDERNTPDDWSDDVRLYTFNDTDCTP